MRCTLLAVLLLGGCMNPPIDQRPPRPALAQDTAPQPPGLPAADSPTSILLEPRGDRITIEVRR